MSYSETLAPDGKAIKVVHLEHESGVQLDIMDWGATWLSCKVRVGSGWREVTLGCADLDGFLAQKAYFGATVGRYANRIGNAQFEYNGTTYYLDANQGGKHQLHGGAGGFSSRRWTIAEQTPQSVAFELVSPDGDQGFPGTLKVRVTYRLLPDRLIRMECEAESDKATPIALTNHAYFNLDGGKTDVREHSLKITASGYTPIDESLIPLGEIASVDKTGFDFRVEKPIKQDFLVDPQQERTKGYDHAWLLDESCASMATPAAVLRSADRRLTLAIHTSMPALQFYSGNGLAGTPARDDGVYEAYQGLALEPGCLPDSPNHPEWKQRSCWLMPGTKYDEKIEFRFQ